MHGDFCLAPAFSRSRIVDNLLLCRPVRISANDDPPRDHIADRDFFRDGFMAGLSPGCTGCLCKRWFYRWTWYTLCFVQFVGDFVSWLEASTSRGNSLHRFWVSTLQVLSPIVRLANGDIQKSLNFMRTCIFFYFLGSCLVHSQLRFIFRQNVPEPRPYTTFS